MGVFLEYVDLRSINMHYRSLQINSQKRDCLHGHIVQEQLMAKYTLSIHSTSRCIFNMV